MNYRARMVLITSSHFTPNIYITVYRDMVYIFAVVLHTYIHTYMDHMLQPISSSMTFYSPSCLKKVECCIGQKHCL